MHKVTMNIPTDEIALIDEMKKMMGLNTNTGVIIQSIRLSHLIMKEINNGKTVKITDPKIKKTTSVVIPGVTRKI